MKLAGKGQSLVPGYVLSKRSLKVRDKRKKIKENLLKYPSVLPHVLLQFERRGGIMLQIRVQALLFTVF